LISGKAAGAATPRSPSPWPAPPLRIGYCVSRRPPMLFAISSNTVMIVE
jgi:hypothetical protein